MRQSTSHFARFCTVVAAASSVLLAADTSEFGQNVLVFDPSMSVTDIQSAADTISSQQVSNQFGTQRYALLFKPGTYGSSTHPLNIQVGYYTEVAGLGESPADVIINGTINVYNQCFDTNNCNALDNFWRSLSNLTIKVSTPPSAGCRDGTDFWAVSQAAPMRRVNIMGGALSLMDYCSAPSYASGGFIADTQAMTTKTIINGSQQQFLVRNSLITGWTNGVWNQVFSGVVGAPTQSFPNPPYTTLPTSPITREKPFLYVGGDGKYKVFVPALQTNSSGTSWGSGPTAGSSLPLSDFLIATPATPVLTIDLALLRGKNLIFTPGVYHYNLPIVVTRPNTVVLGLGFPTLVPQNELPAMTLLEPKGVKIAGLLFDAGPADSPVLLDVGLPFLHSGDASNPTSLHDVFFRIGGATAGRARSSLVVNSSHVLLDDIWAWRADHGNGVGWTANTADTGVIVNGDDVTAYGLFVEHFQKYQLVWNGDNGRTIMFQNEMPYDPPSQAAWMHDGTNGYAAYKVADSVHAHEAWGLGSYCNFTVNASPAIHATRAFEVPVTPGVKLHDLVTVFLSGFGAIDNVVNNAGGSTGAPGQPTTLTQYP